jgi:hypothetical protein
MRHDPALARLAARAIHPMACGCSRCAPLAAYRAAFGWLAAWSAPIHAAGYAAAAAALLLMPGRWLAVWIWP